MELGECELPELQWNSKNRGLEKERPMVCGVERKRERCAIYVDLVKFISLMKWQIKLHSRIPSI